MEVVASLSQGRTAAAQCGLFTYKSVPVIFEPPCIRKNLLFVGGIILKTEIHLVHNTQCPFALNAVLDTVKTTGLRVKHTTKLSEASDNYRTFERL